MAGLVAYGLVWSFGLGGFPNPETVAAWANRFGLTGAPTATIVGVGVVMLATAGIIASLARALGEEIGWRGFLIWELRKLMPFWAVGLVSGLIWALWHVPAILGTDYNAGTGSALFQVGMFFANVITASVIFASFHFPGEITLARRYSSCKPQSLCPGHLHTIDDIWPDHASWVDEFGIALPIIYALFALYFIR